MPTPRSTPAQRLAALDAKRARLRHAITSAERRADAHRKIVLGAVVAAAGPDLDGDLLAGVLLAYGRARNAECDTEMRSAGRGFLAARSSASAKPPGFSPFLPQCDTPARGANGLRQTTARD